MVGISSFIWQKTYFGITKDLWKRILEHWRVIFVPLNKTLKPARNLAGHRISQNVQVEAVEAPFFEILGSMFTEVKVSAFLLSTRISLSRGETSSLIENFFENRRITILLNCTSFPSVMIIHSF